MKGFGFRVSKALGEVMGLVALIAVLCFGLAVVGQGNAQAAPVMRNDLSTVRAAAILTTSDVASTFTVPVNTNYQDFYIDFTIGSLTSVTLWPAGAATGNPATSGYYKNDGTSYTLSATGVYLWRVPTSAFGAYTYQGIVAKGTGTVTNSSLKIQRRTEVP